ncbi:MAG TPA: hypothetical protein VK864_10250 [Longimicrobiales bacterium]|nr:hypothetical protein [Longimicrobiales bacterium]
MFPRANDDGAALRGARAIAAAGAAQLRVRSFCFIESAGRRWTVFLVTYPRDDGQWRGYFTFRSADYETGGAEIRTADLFVETTEAGVDSRARGLGRPLLQALLDSALHTFERRQRSADYNAWFRDLLSKHATDVAPRRAGAGALTYDQLRSHYDSYRIDQVAHLIALMSVEDFRRLVETLLEGRVIDFLARDRFQLAMTVVQDLERRLLLPPFEVWVEDYLAHPDEYHRYAYQLHHSSELP